MATTTFSGPIKAGNIKDTTGSTVGTNVANVGYVLMAQSAVIDIAGASNANQVVGTIPANSQIVDAILNVTTANNDTTASTVVVGTSADPDAFIPSTSVQSAGTTRGTLDTEATDVGTTDIQVLADFAATVGDGTAGVASVTILYIQNNNLS
jgi:hypothetical protein